MSDTLFHGSHLPLLKWFWALYFIGSDKGSISALRLSKLIEVNWKTARLMLMKVRAAMGHRDSLYRLSGTIELDDAFVGGKHKGKRGRGAEGKTPVIIACENKDKKAGFIAMKAVTNVNFKTVKEFVSHHLLANQYVRTDAYPALNIIDKTQQHSLLNNYKNRTARFIVFIRGHWLKMPVHILITHFAIKSYKATLELFFGKYFLDKK